MELKVGDTIPYFDPTSKQQVDAEITNIREDGTVDILYPHPLYPTEIRTTAESYRPSGAVADTVAEALPAAPQSDGLMKVSRTVKKDTA